MRRPFEQLMTMVASPDLDDEVTLGQLAERWGEPVSRIMDAMDAVKVMCGIPSYVAVDDA